ncbi:MAG: RNA polymerase sigma factor [Acidimicrobiales bacterium]
MTATMVSPVRSRPAGLAYSEGREPTAAELLQAAARAEPRAWQQLVQRFSGSMQTVARSYGLNQADVADVTQVVWLRLFDRLDQIREPEHVGAWLKTTTRYECLRVLRRRDRVTPVPDIELVDDVDHRDPFTEAGTREQYEIVSNLIQTLPALQKDLMQMLLLDPVPTYKVISSALGIPIGSIGPTRQRCLLALRNKCMEAGVNDAHLDAA